MRVTPSNIQELDVFEVFVFGSNLAGRHGKGAAKMAMSFGAKYGKGIGLQGNTYAIPTKDERLNILQIEEIKKHVDNFISYAKNSMNIFFVTEIGCGLAGYKPQDIAPLFRNATNKYNIYLPESFWNVLNLE